MWRLSHRKLTSTGDLYAFFNFAGPYQILALQRGGDCGGRFLGAGGDTMIKFRMRDLSVPIAVSSLLQSLEARASNAAKAKAKAKAAEAKAKAS